MDSKRKLAYMIIKHLKSESKSSEYSEDVHESLEVAIECLENCYKINDQSSSEFDNGKTLMDLVDQDLKSEELNRTKAEECKTKGNDLMKAGKHQEAIDSYTAAIALSGNNAIYYSNRAAAYNKLGSFEKAIADSESAVKIDPNFSRAYGRMGLAYLNLQNYEKAKESCEKALSLDPTNESYQTNLNLIKEKMNTEKKPAESQSQPQPQQAGGMPNLGGIDFGSLLSNPAVMNMAQNLMQNPQMQQMFSSFANAGAGGQGGEQAAAGGDPTAGGGAPAGGFGNMNFNELLGASQQFARNLQDENPELAAELKSQFKNAAPKDDSKDDPK
eukprot:gene3532-4033_t